MENDSKTCKNCSAEIIGEYCHSCGQRYHDHKLSFGELAFEFLSDFLHFDSRFFKTVLPLLFLPGKLTRQYNAGKQKSQFHPIRLYLFSSFLYFLVFFALNNPFSETSHTDLQKESSTGIADTTLADTEVERRKFVEIKNSRTNFAITVPSNIDSVLKQRVTPEAYKKDQASKPKVDRDGLFVRMLTVRLLEVNLEGEVGKKEYLMKVVEGFLHNIPKMMFILLPVFALFLKLLYFRKKQFYYVDHAILSLHFFSFIFLLLTLSSFGLDRLFDTMIFTGLSVIWIIIYLYIAMKRLYSQGWFRTLVKLLLIVILFIVSLFALTMVNLAWSTLM